jgi:hypothetical protein
MYEHSCDRHSAIPEWPEVPVRVAVGVDRGAAVAERVLGMRGKLEVAPVVVVAHELRPRVSDHLRCARMVAEACSPRMVMESEWGAYEEFLGNGVSLRSVHRWASDYLPKSRGWL